MTIPAKKLNDHGLTYMIVLLVLLLVFGIAFAAYQAITNQKASRNNITDTATSGIERSPNGPLKD